MFSSLGLFHNVPCPQRNSCARPNCLFSHNPHVKEQQISVSYDEQHPVAGPSVPTPAVSSSPASALPRPVVPAKRPQPAPSAHASSKNSSGTSTPTEPPRKIVKTAFGARPIALPAASTVGHNTSYMSIVFVSLTPFLRLQYQTGAPVLRVNAAQSKIPVATRQVRTAPQHPTQ